MTEPKASLGGSAASTLELLREAWAHLAKMHDLAEYHLFEIETIAQHGDAEERGRYTRVLAEYEAAENFIGTHRAALAGDPIEDASKTQKSNP